MKTITRIDRAGRTRVFRRRVSVHVGEGPDRGKRFTTTKRAFTVGTAPTNDFVLTDAGVSRHHLRIEYGDNGLQLTDLDSTNGTWLGDLRLVSGFIDKEKEVEIGESFLQIGFLEEEEIALPDVDRFGEVLGKSPAMLELFGYLHQVVGQDVTVLLEGESGTGKEMLAHEVHRHSPRASEPYVVVDCGAIPDQLIASELFGHVRGAFTGADRDREGAFEAANGGTIFLDEIGELDLALQPQLLRVLETGEIKRAGETHYRKVDVRVVAATNRDLQREVNAGHFRADLYYRLAVVPLRVPPLRKRGGDLELVARHMFRVNAKRFGKTDAELTDAQLADLQKHSWPGNLRELRNAVERLVLFGGKGPTAPQETPEVSAGGLSMDALEDVPFVDAKTRWVDYFEYEYVKRLLAKHGGKVTEAARAGTIGRAHLFRLVKKHGIERG